MIAVMQSDDPLGMFDPQTPINDSWPWQPDWPRAAVQTSKNVFWGLGWGLEHAPNGWYFWQWGDNTHFKAFVMGSRATGSGFVALTNSIHGDRLWPHLIHEFLGDEHPVISCLGQF